MREGRDWHIAAEGEWRSPTVCPELAKADMAPFWRGSAYDPNRSMSELIKRKGACLC